MATRAPLRENLRLPFKAGELTRRLELAREDNPEVVDGPKRGHLLREALWMLEPVRRPVRQWRKPFALAQSANPKTVMVLPGFATHPVRMRYFAGTLERAGHTVKRWGLGFNWGPTEENFAQLERRLLDLRRRSGQKIHMVGWSLGGLFARELAKKHPSVVAQVITMGTPFSYSPRANNAWRIYQFVAGHRVDQPPVGGVIAEKPPVRTVALWSPNDGIIHPRAACGKPGERDLAIPLRCGHLGFAYSEESIAAVARELERD